MKKVLVIGSTVADVIIRLDKLPTTGGDVNVRGQKMSMGGCAFNVSQAIAYFDVPYLLFSPIGTGIYADYIRKEIAGMEVTRAELNPDEPNGCCYCLVEDDGERTFICDHGTEYKFKEEWYKNLDPNDFDCAYICGLEIEEDTGDFIIDFLENSHIPFYFAPGPRINEIEKTVAVFDTALNYKDNDNVITDGEELYDLLVDNGTCGMDGFAKVLTDIAVASGIIKKDQANSLLKSVKDTYDNVFDEIDKVMGDNNEKVKEIIETPRE